MDESEKNLKINFEKDETYLEKFAGSMDEIFEKHISESEKHEKDLFEHWKKPEWDEYFMSMALLISMRSIDPSQKNGCVIVDENKRVLSVGYNGFPRGSKDELIPLKRPDKHLFIIHAEKNAILNKQFDIINSTIYVTAFPCLSCMRTIIQSGIKRHFLYFITLLYSKQSIQCLLNNVNSLKSLPSGCNLQVKGESCFNF